MYKLEKDMGSNKVKFYAGGHVFITEAYDIYGQLEKIRKTYRPGEVLLDIALEDLRPASQDVSQIIENIQILANYLQITFADAYVSNGKCLSHQ